MAREMSLEEQFIHGKITNTGELSWTFDFNPIKHQHRIAYVQKLANLSRIKNCTHFLLLFLY